MTYASDEDIETLKKYFSDDEFKAALDDPAPGIFDQSSWTKWNQRYGRTPIPPLPKDRKSTRLNSSHSQISYAVFCLKKKNKNSSDIVQSSHSYISIAHVSIASDSSN